MRTTVSEDKNPYLDSKYICECISSWDILWAIPYFFFLYKDATEHN